METREKKSKEKAWWAEGLGLFSQITAWIVAPVITALFLGNFLDNRYGTSPRYLLICVGIAFIITNIGLIIEMLRYQKRLKDITQDNHERHTKRNE